LQDQEHGQASQTKERVEEYEEERLSEDASLKRVAKKSENLESKVKQSKE
jgi:hypothetical protein